MQLSGKKQRAPLSVADAQGVLQQYESVPMPWELLNSASVMHQPLCVVPIRRVTAADWHSWSSPELYAYMPQPCSEFELKYY